MAKTKKTATKKKATKATKTKKKTTKRELVVLVRWKGKQENLRFCDGWATLSLNGWAAGLHLDVDSVMLENEINDAIESFLNLDAFMDTKTAQWDFRVVVPLEPS